MMQKTSFKESINELKTIEEFLSRIDLKNQQKSHQNISNSLFTTQKSSGFEDHIVDDNYHCPHTNFEENEFPSLFGKKFQHAITTHDPVTKLVRVKSSGIGDSQTCLKHEYSFKESPNDMDDVFFNDKELSDSLTQPCSSSPVVSVSRLFSNSEINHFDSFKSTDDNISTTFSNYPDDLKYYNGYGSITERNEYDDLDLFDYYQNHEEPKVFTIKCDPKYKTELCRNYEAGKICNYGRKCQFAHGKAELRPQKHHPNYKTKPCIAYHLDGLCNYGKRCNFIHDEIKVVINK